MNIFVTGATGYIGGTVAARLFSAGHAITGLTRTQQGAARLRERGIIPVIGTLDDAALLTRQTQSADAIINAADSDNRPAIDAFIAALTGTGKILIHTSGSSIISDAAAGEASDVIYDEDTPFQVHPDKAPRVAIDQAVRDAVSAGIRAAVICPCMIYGAALGIHQDSDQLPRILRTARQTGAVRYIGKGRNVWSNIHVQDLADLYLLTLQNIDAVVQAGGFLFAENGEASFLELTMGLAEAMHLPAPISCSIEDAIGAWGYGAATHALGSNSRIRARRPRTLLGWSPKHSDILSDIPRTVAVLDIP